MPPLPTKARVAFKIAARARKFVLEGCPVEGYDYLYACLAEAKDSDTELYTFLLVEVQKFEERVDKLLEESETQ